MYDVVVIGAGPAGLTLAVGLGHRGLSCLVVERGEHPATGTRCAVVQEEPLEALAALGVHLTDPRWSFPLRNRVFHVGRHAETRPVSRRALVLSQERTELLLEEAARRYGVPVERGVEAVGVRQGADHVDVDVRHSGGSAVLRARWLVMCTGADGRLPAAAGLGWTAERPRSLWWTAVDATVTGLPGLEDGEEHIFHGPHANLGLLPLPSGGCRIFSASAVEPTHDAGGMEAFARRITGTRAGLSLEGEPWLTRPASGRGRRARDGRCLVLGEAARRLPMPVQSVNTAIEEAAELAGELAAVALGRSRPGALDAYAARRAEAADRLIADGWNMLDRGTTPDPERWLVGPRRGTA